MNRFLLAIVLYFIPLVANAQVMNWGHFKDGDGTKYVYFNTVDPTTGAPANITGTPAVDIYEDGDTTPITTATTPLYPFNSVVGLNRIAIDLTNAGFDTNKVYTAVLSGTGSVSTVSIVGRIVGVFRLGGAPSDPIAINGNEAAAQGLAEAWDGDTDGAPLRLTKLKVVNAAGPAVTIEAGSGGAGVTITGEGAGNGMNITAGDDAIGISVAGGSPVGVGNGGAAVSLVGGTPDSNGDGGAGLYVQGGSKTGSFIDGNGLELVGGGNGGHGMSSTGGATTGSGMKITGGNAGPGISVLGSTVGIGVSANNGHGVNIESTGGTSAVGLNILNTLGTAVTITAGSNGGTPVNGTGIQIVGGGNGSGILTMAGLTGTGLYARGNNAAGSNGNGVQIAGAQAGNASVLRTNGHAVHIDATGTNKAGINVLAGTDYEAVRLAGDGTGNGLLVTGGVSGHGIYARGDTATGTGNGLKVEGGASNGIGMYVSAPNAVGATFQGGVASPFTGAGHAIRFLGAGTGFGMEIKGGTPNGAANGGVGIAIAGGAGFSSGNGGVAITATGGAGAGAGGSGADGITVTAGNGTAGGGRGIFVTTTNGHGFEIDASGTGKNGFLIEGGTGADIVGNGLEYLFELAYNPASKPGNAAGLLNVMVEDNGTGVPQFTAIALEEMVA